MTDQQQYKLSATLAGHAADVRALATAPPSPSSNSHPYSPAQPVLFSSSRDGTARSWISTGTEQGRGSDGEPAGQASTSGGQGWTEGLTFGGAQGHEGFVNAVEWLPGTGEVESGESPFSVQTRAFAIEPIRSCFRLFLDRLPLDGWTRQIDSCLATTRTDSSDPFDFEFPRTEPYFDRSRRERLCP